jgi:hypothetical protein
MTNLDTKKIKKTHAMANLPLSLPEAKAKTLLIKYLYQQKKLNNSAIISELAVGRYSNRADLVVAGSKLHCFEIKTAFDSLDRLPDQIYAFSKCFSEVSVVAASKHVPKLFDIIPCYVGVTEIFKSNGDLNLRSIRQPLQSEEVSIRSLLDLLPVAQLKLLVKDKDAKLRGDLVSLADDMELNEVQNHVLKFLKSRYRESTRQLRSTLRKKGFSENDLNHLKIWPKKKYPCENDFVDVAACSDWDLYRHVGRSFGPVPEDIVDMLNRLD